jgi:uracil-DNA glycosylase
LCDKRQPMKPARQLDLVSLAKSTEELAKAAEHCKNCDLWKNATQTVFGEGSSRAKIMMIGEQPGNQEDLQGKPFVGPAGQLLDRLLVEAGVDRKKVYVTNALKHFKWGSRGKRRVHKRPSAKQIAACRPWLDAEMAAIKPTVIVCFGATAAQALLGRTFRVTASSVRDGHGSSFLDLACPRREGTARAREKIRRRHEKDRQAAPVKRFPGRVANRANYL